MKTASGFNGRRFVNPYAVVVPLSKMAPWLLSRQKPEWVVPHLNPLEYEGLSCLHHSTCSIKLNGCHIVTDPIWERVCGPLGLIGPRRPLKHLPTDIEELERVDVILLSHNHFDHMCLKTLRYLKKRFNPLIVTGLGNSRYLKGIGGVIELDWWKSYHMGDIRVTYVPAAHFSARGLFDRFRALWGGFVIEQRGKKIYFAGDSGWAGHFQEIADHFGAIDYCFLPIGSYKPENVLERVHIGPREAVKLHKLFQAKKSIPIHCRTFQLGDESWEEPIEELKKALDQERISYSEFLI